MKFKLWHLPFDAPVSFDAAVYALKLVLEAVFIRHWFFAEVHRGCVRGEGICGAVAG